MRCVAFDCSVFCAGWRAGLRNSSVCRRAVSAAFSEADPALLRRRRGHAIRVLHRGDSGAKPGCWCTAVAGRSLRRSRVSSANHLSSPSLSITACPRLDSRPCGRQVVQRLLPGHRRAEALRLLPAQVHRGPLRGRRERGRCVVSRVPATAPPPPEPSARPSVSRPRPPARARRRPTLPLPLAARPAPSPLLFLLWFSAQSWAPQTFSSTPLRR